MIMSTFSLLMSLWFIAPGGDTPATLLSSARKFEKAGQFERALIAYERVLEQEAANSEAISRLGLMYLKKGLYKRAMERYAKIVGTAPASAQAWYFLGYARRKGGDCVGAIAAFSSYSELVPDDPDPHFSRARCLEKLGKAGAAITAYNTFVRLSSKQNNAYVLKALRALSRLRKSPQSTAPGKSVVTGANDPDRHYKKALALYGKGQKIKAFDQILLGLSVSPNHRVLLTGLGTLTMEAGRCAMALPHLRRGVSLFPRSKVLLYVLPWCQNIMGDKKDAAKGFEGYLNVFPREPSVLFQLAALHEELKNISTAIRYYREYIFAERRGGQERWIQLARHKITLLAKRVGKLPTPVPSPEKPRIIRTPAGSSGVSPGMLDSLFLNIQKNIARGDYAAARRQTKELVRRGVKHGRIPVFQAEFALERGDLKEAVGYIRRAVAIEPSLVAILRVKGLLKVRERFKPEALVLFTAYLKGAQADPLEKPHLPFIIKLIKILSGK